MCEAVVVSHSLLKISAALEKISTIALARIFQEPRFPQIDRLQLLLLMSRNWLASNPADKIYGLMGLVDSHQRVRADYSRSCVEIYTDFAGQRLADEPTPWLLNMASCSVPIPNLPS